MPRLNPVQTSFGLGEVSPRMYARTEIKGYREGAKILEGMIPLAQGPLRRRSGIVFAQELAAGVLQAKVIAFPVAADDYFILVFYDLFYIILNKFGEAVAPELVLNPEFNSGGASWTVFAPAGGTVTFSLVSCSMDPAAVPGNAAIRQLVTGLEVGKNYRLRATQTGVLRSIRLRVGTSAGGAQTATSTGSSISVVCAFVATATSHWIEVAAMTPSVATVLTNVSVQSTEIPPSPQASPFTADTLSQIQEEMAPAGNVMMLTNGIHAPQQLTYTAPATFALANAVFVAPPAEWTAGNYPRALTFYQGRLWFGGTKAQPSKFWGSKSGSYLDFTTGTLADDALAYTIAKRGAIRWMQGLKSLLIGTETQELVVSSAAGVIVPTDIDMQPQSTYGSSATKPVLLGNQVVYLNGDGRKLFSMGYRFEESGWVSTDLAFAAEHIGQSRFLSEAYCQNPESVIWLIDGQSKLIGCSYDRGNNIVGWHRHPSPLAFLSCTTVKFLGSDVSWFAYRVVRNGVSFVQIGVMLGVIGSGVYMDSAKRVSVPILATVFSGFQHLAGQTVQVVADGAVRPEVVVSAGGTITLDAPALEVLAGLKTPLKFVSLPVEPGAQGQATQPAMKRSNRIFVLLTASARPIINGVRPPDRDPSSPMDIRQPPKTELLFVSNLGWERQETITVEEDLPIDVSFNGIYLEMAEEQS